VYQILEEYSSADNSETELMTPTQTGAVTTLQQAALMVGLHVYGIS
jgi:tryptophanase